LNSEPHASQDDDFGELHTYYSDSLITITDQAVRIGSTIYVVGHINSVKVTRVRANRLGMGVLGAIVFGTLGVIGAALVMPRSDYGDVLLAIIALAGGLLGFVVGMAALKDPYAVHVCVSSGDTGSVVSHDLEYVKSLERYLMLAVVDYHVDRQTGG
jgi:hypothetical protein